MNLPSPPRWLERSLTLLLSARDRETVSGDLLEAYREEHLPHSGQLRADLWYARQVISFAPRRLANIPQAPRLLTLISAFTALSGGWLGLMDFLLQHPGYPQREIISATIVGQALLTLFAVHLRQNMKLRILALGGSAGILYLGIGALIGVLKGSHFEGYILVIALALIAQTLLTVLTLPRRSGPSELKNQPL